MANATKPEDERKWAEMSGGERMIWCGKFLVALATAGFAYPNIMDPLIKARSRGAGSTDA